MPKVYLQSKFSLENHVFRFNNRNYKAKHRKYNTKLKDLDRKTRQSILPLSSENENHDKNQNEMIVDMIFTWAKRKQDCFVIDKEKKQQQD
jgi:hypothetical protein